MAARVAECTVVLNQYRCSPVLTQNFWLAKIRSSCSRAFAPGGARLGGARMKRGGEPVEVQQGWKFRPSHQGAQGKELSHSYSLVKCLGRGGMAEVFRARREKPDGSLESCVIKRILPELACDAHLVNMFFDEARLTALLRHP